MAELILVAALRFDPRDLCQTCGRSLVSNQILRFRCRECRLNLISPLPLSGKLPHKQPKTSWQSKKPNSDQWPLYRRQFCRGTNLLEGVYQPLWSIQWGKHWPTEEDRTKLMRRGESRILTKRMHEENRKSCFDDTQSNDKSGTRYIIVLDWSLLLIWYREHRDYQLFFHWFRWAWSIFEVWDLYIFVYYNPSIHRKITAHDHFSNLNSSSIRPDKNEINQSKSIQSYNIKVKNTFAYNSKN